MSPDDVNLSEWLATPEGPPERVWRAAMRLVASEETPAGDPAQEAAADHHSEEIVDSVPSGDLPLDGTSFEGHDLDPAHPEPPNPHEGAPASHAEEDFDGDPLA